METARAIPMPVEQNKALSETVRRETDRLRKFISTRVPDPGDAEDILQDVFYELTETYALLKPIENAGAWLFRVCLLYTSDAADE